MMTASHASRRFASFSFIVGMAVLGAGLGGAGRELRAQEVAEAEAPTGQADIAKDVKRIREEALQRSQVMDTLNYLTNVIGPRLTNSPGMLRANHWTCEQMTEWGLQNAHTEAWGPFGTGWTLKKFSAQVVEPNCIPLIAFPKAWSPSLPGGRVETEVVYFNPKTEDEVADYAGKLAGKVVLIGSTADLPAWFEPPGRRYTDTELLRLANAPNPYEGSSRSMAGTTGMMEQPDSSSRIAVRRKMGELLEKEPPAITLEPSFRGDGGTLFVHSASSNPAGSFASRSRQRAWDKDATGFVPQLVLAIEHFNRLVRMIEAGQKLTIAIELEADFQDEDLMGYNSVAEIPGSDLADELVLMGGHLDSWHAGTGATDNASGCAVAMEAARILRSLELKPRRTIRVVLWSGEEQGLYGSRAYVTEHFGSVEDEPISSVLSLLFGGRPRRLLLKKPAYDQFCGYFNYDNGTGKIRGVHMEGNEAMRPIFRSWLAPFGEDGASTLTLSRTGGTDHMSFDAIGLPGFQFIQDEIEYDTRTHHSNMDVYERLQADDLKQSAAIMAAFVYQAAMADEKLPRKPEPGGE